MLSRVLYFFLFLLLLITSCDVFKKKSRAESGSSSRRTSEPKQHSYSVLEKYSKKLGTEVDNEKLYSFIDIWEGTPYKYGGKTKEGVDCSNFTCTLLRQVYAFPNEFYFSSSKLAEKGEGVNLGKLREGDLLFFSINQNSKISHVGIYLANQKFVHASTSKGVIISSLEEDYYKKRITVAKRILKL